MCVCVCVSESARIQGWQSSPGLVQQAWLNINPEGEASGSIGQLLPHIHIDLGASMQAAGQQGTLRQTSAEWLSTRMLGKVHQPLSPPQQTSGSLGGNHIIGHFLDVFSLIFLRSKSPFIWPQTQQGETSARVNILTFIPILH